MFNKGLLIFTAHYLQLQSIFTQKVVDFTLRYIINIKPFVEQDKLRKSLDDNVISIDRCFHLIGRDQL